MKNMDWKYMNKVGVGAPWKRVKGVAEWRFGAWEIYVLMGRRPLLILNCGEDIVGFRQIGVSLESDQRAMNSLTSFAERILYALVPAKKAANVKQKDGV